VDCCLVLLLLPLPSLSTTLAACPLPEFLLLVSALGTGLTSNSAAATAAAAAAVAAAVGAVLLLLACTGALL
jgi:hypothetical protein